MTNWSFWFELVIRSAALLITGEVLRRMNKTCSAAFRHRLLLWIFALLALMPVLALCFPEIPLAFWSPARDARARVTAREIAYFTDKAPPVHSANWPLVVWLSGVLLTASPIAIGAICAWTMARRAIPLRTSAFGEACQQFSSLRSMRTQILVSGELTIPLTCGFVRPRILLPPAAEHWESSRLAAVLLHESAHVLRRDVGAQLVAHMVAALWWFQPLGWLLSRRLRAESEFACDAEVLRAGFRPSEYAAELLAIAETMGRNARLSSAAIGMVRSGDLENRLRTVLSTPDALPRPKRTYALALALGSIAIAASAVTLNPSHSLNEQGGSTMKRTILSALLTTAGLSAATVSGTIHDPNGAALPDVKMLIYNPDTGAKQEAVTGSDGKFSFQGTAAGQYILRAEKPGFNSLFREFDLKADSRVEREFTMANEGGQAVADTVINTDEGQAKRVRVGGMVAQSNLITKVQPVYPAAAKEARTQGTVEIETTISKDGVPLELRVLASPSDDLSRSALEAVRQWRYRPTLLNGEPIEIITDVVVNYTLSR